VYAWSISSRSSEFDKKNSDMSKVRKFVLPVSRSYAFSPVSLNLGLTWRSRIRALGSRRTKAMGRKYRIPVITGMGVVSPLGVGLATFWKALEDGASSVREISLFDATSYPCRIAAEVRAFSAEEFLSEKEMRTYPRQTQFALAGTAMALKDAGNPDLDLARTDVILGAAQISFEALETEIAEGQHSLQKYEPRLDPFGVLKTTMSIPASAVAFRFRTQGSAVTLTSACTSGIDAIAMAANRIRNGEAEAVITGGTETPITRIVLNAFCAARMVTTVSNDSPEAAMAPFDAKRTKSVLGEGAAILLLEEKQDALARGARIYCRWVDTVRSPRIQTHCSQSIVRVLRGKECYVVLSEAKQAVSVRSTHTHPVIALLIESNLWCCRMYSANSFHVSPWHPSRVRQEAAWQRPARSRWSPGR